MKNEIQHSAITSKQFDQLIESIRRIGEGSPTSNPTGFELLSIALAGEGLHDSVAAALREIAEGLKEVADAIRGIE